MMAKSKEQRLAAARRAARPGTAREHAQRDAQEALSGQRSETKRLSVDVDLETFVRLAALAAGRDTSKKQLAERVVTAVTIDPDILDRVDRAITGR